MTTITDPDVQALAAISASLEPEYRGEGDPWAGSPFAWIKSQASRRRGKIGEQLIAGFLAARDFDVVRSTDSEADRVVNGHRVEVKFSTLWESGSYTFQQIRDQRYELAICLGVSPFDAHCWAVPKAVLLEHVIGKRGQHSGARAKDTAWFTVTPGRPEPWLSPHGGTLAEAVLVMRTHLPRRVTR